MEKAVLHPYLMFEGNCREAMEFYKGIFGGELNMMTFGQVDNSCPAAIRDHIMHASLMGGEIDFMACDTPKPGPLGGDKIQLSLSGFDEANLRNKFAQLSEGGTITVPMEKQVWGDIFGAFKDKYGIDWMIDVRAQ
ncbi:PhnB protein [Dyadobacter sp. BE34]|uniref:PhnB protein n=1 Tax=Dyadobacter fermentans TaxID=94254 RepID=A0ABU1QTF6_9BACT|nr:MULTISPECIES: VOC family protein [Dyadobacter]MDR6804461.1 PhnB protein [Dyadobacter fermentans]MDR7042201.1 PhnB protein [Dyadobacter sp. BE242]MDR7196603.1 PhnB protein [Dyadobacter sp. BE34]MDR7212851.1 PhnB protein [Dyadobacter sp. BE31]MDR7262010.1 PhnB protein [Dyadobacter sp. BE32]